MSEMRASVPVLPVRDIGRAAEFYAGKLGFEVTHQDDGYAIVARDHIEIHLWAATDERWKGRDSDRPVVSGAETFLAGTASCRVEVSGIEEFCDEFVKSGTLHPNGPLVDKPYGLRECAALDLDGNLITLFQPLE
jgi:catechol 2,3-dioxygenase-like lactoylglutathione lyase family enzyme